ncbi:hypothetical protein GCM10007416_08270 [Kroppenstedtia guangzhouensis]|uniref:Uncharacterized protein n=1 Tax=Kroppenstedtia guangzhouensis TaxID=1274356 RepID=A0ABQ1G6L6_9BACL|nr:hypothetical protein GCM10007416_08270 [Kroppenstedtia guangzhouensis]
MLGLTAVNGDITRLKRKFGLKGSLLYANVTDFRRPKQSIRFEID